MGEQPSWVTSVFEGCRTSEDSNVLLPVDFCPSPVIDFCPYGLVYLIWAWWFQFQLVLLRRSWYLEVGKRILPHRPLPAFLVVAVNFLLKDILNTSLKADCDEQATFWLSKVHRFISDTLWFVREIEDKARLRGHLWEMRFLNESSPAYDEAWVM